jgi:hypothetical protein
MLKEIGLIFVIVDTAGRFGCGWRGNDERDWARA